MFIIKITGTLILEIIPLGIIASCKPSIYNIYVRSKIMRVWARSIFRRKINIFINLLNL